MEYELDRSRMPQHVAIIMDGNGRWANERGQARTFGHKAGGDNVTTITAECVRLGIKYLTLYTFSTENWNRPPEEVAALMDLIMEALEKDLFSKNNVRFRTIGDLSRLPENVRQKALGLEQRTAGYTAMTVVIALSYSSRWEITEAVRQIVKEQPETITEETVSSHLAHNFMPDPELLIRTGGELRLSNYLLWQAAYSELYFCDTYWPDFNEECLHKAIADYQRRQRRFGKTEAQVEAEGK